MDQFRESLDRIGELSDDELKQLKDSVKSEFDTVATQDPTHDVVDQMTQLADAAEAIKAEGDRRAAEAAQLSQAASDAQSRMAGLDDSSDDDAATDGSGDDLIDSEESDQGVTDDASAPADGPVEDDTETPAADEAETDESVDTPADAEGSPAEEAKETPDEEAKEDAAPADDSEDEDPSADSDISDDDKKKLNNFSDVAAVETTIDAPAESEAASVETEAPAKVEAEAELSIETVETVAENAPEAEASADAKADAELATEETATPAAEAEFASEETESSEEPVTASNTPLDFQAPADNAPAIAAEVAPVTITAGADIPGVPMGSELPNLRSVAQAILDRKKAMGRTSGGDGEQHTVAQFTTTFPADRTLASSDFDGNQAKIEAVVSAEAIVAAGGFMAPVPVRYELFGLGDTNRPVKDSLAVFGADRGGIRYITPPVLTDLNGSVSLWTLQDDLDALTDTTKVKPCIRVAAGAEVTVYVDAIPLCLTFGNLGARAYPELVERHTQLGMIWHARYAETRLLTRIGSLSTAVTADKSLGVVRDILGQVDQAAAGYRNRHRIAADSTLRVIFPEWFKDALRSDIAKQLPGDGIDDTLALAEAKINSWFAARHINVTWTLDGETGQIMGAQAVGALNTYPANVVWYLFAEGTFLFLDQGTLDLGLVRDSTLNSTNDYKIFLETFEGVAKVGVESLRITSTLAIRGSSSATTVLA